MTVPLLDSGAGEPDPPVFGETPCDLCRGTTARGMYCGRWDLTLPDLDAAGRTGLRCLGHDVPSEADSFSLVARYLCSDCYARMEPTRD